MKSEIYIIYCGWRW